MYLIALTGGIASGKSLVASRLRDLGAVHIDADQLAREVVEPGTDGLREIAREFGPDVIDSDGALDRAALGARVFGHPEKLAVLNRITHPRVRELATARIQEAAAANPAAIIVYDVPLLAEAGGKHAVPFDSIVVVHADESERVRRMVEYRGMSRDDALSRVGAQASDEERLAIADVVIENNGTVEQVIERVDEYWRELDARGAGSSQPSVGGPA
ncbi:dephospho-CoA kinase [Salinibacterium sp. GXW1014]|uniref:dephospho-CoA kinase n=1 Tax=Salinibacterium sp. GXW1014 TaxID=3377838 RepID=UPI003839F515